VNDDEQIVSYLLGELDDDDRTRLEERYMRDVEYRELMRAVEDDLIDEYVRGELSAEQRSLFEKQFTSEPHRARKVELARALTKALGEGRRVSEPQPKPLTFPVPRRPASSNALRYALAAAALVIITVGVWLATESRRSRPGVQQPQTAEQIPQPEQTPQTAPDERTDRPAPQLSIATFVLAPGLTRDAAGDRTFVIPEGTQIVRLRLPLDKGDEYPAYRAELNTASGNSVWKGDQLRSQPEAAGQSLVLDVPADLLRSDRYELALTGINKDIVEDIGYYYFGFVRK
jgi:anti-sigma factor RsiW